MSAVDTRRLKERGGRPLGARLFFCLLLLPAMVLADELDELQALALAGAPQLALKQLDATQPDLQTDLRGWVRWERARVEMLAGSGHWRIMAERLAQLPTEAPRGFSRWAAQQRAEALLAAGEPQEARAVLRRLIWSGEGNREQLALWRQLVIRSYLQQGRNDDAYTALSRYRMDYGEGGQGDALLRARVLLTRGLTAEALRELNKLSSAPERDLLMLLARHRHGESVSFKKARAMAEAVPADAEPRLQALAWATAAEVAGGETALRIIALEKLFAHRSGLSGQADLFPYTADALWQAYLSYGESVGNQRQLLMGDDEAWFALAEEGQGRYPVRSHSLYALLAERAFAPHVRERAHAALAESLGSSDEGYELLRHLYLESGHFASAEALPLPVRHVLLDRVIAEADLLLAARLLTGMDESPTEADQFLWQLRRAKVFILAGEHESAEQVIELLLQSPQLAQVANRDRLIQLLFDLQTVAEHERAYRLLSLLFPRVHDPKTRRELLFWMADSRKAQRQPLEAARLYLQSATLPGPRTMDPWAQTARYQAAEALAEGGLLEDAAGLYRTLLAVTEDPARRAVLRRKLEQLQLHRR